MAATLLILIGFAFVCWLGWSGLRWLVAGLRGRCVDSTPHCRGCGYNVSAHMHGVTRCPECGADLHQTGAVFLQRRPELARCSIGLVLFTLSSVAMTATLIGLADKSANTTGRATSPAAPMPTAMMSPAISDGLTDRR